MDDEHITSATETDIPPLNVLINSAYRGDSSRKGWTTEADLLGGIRTTETDLRAMLANPRATILKYEQAGSILGCVYLEEKGSELYLGMLTVSPDAQANGIGKKLMLAAEALAQEKGLSGMVMSVISVREELIAFYERRGYQKTGETIPFPKDPRFGEPKRELEFIIMQKPLLTHS